MKLRRIAVISSCLLFSSPGHTGGIPTFDGVAIAQQLQTHMETIMKWKMQYDQMKSQIDQFRMMYDSFTGSRGLGTILNNPMLRNYLPAEWQSVYDSVRSGGYEGLSGASKAIYDANRIFNNCQNMLIDDERIACESRSIKPYQDKTNAMAAYDAAKSRLEQIDGLMGKINEATDPKAMAELNARILAEQAMIQNESTKMQLYEMISRAEERIQEQKQKELNARVWANEKVGSFKPLTFN